MMSRYEITWKDGSENEIVECDAIQQQGNTVLFLEVGAVQTAQGTINGEIILSVNFLELKCWRKLPKLNLVD